MTESEASSVAPPIVHGLLVCRNAEVADEGRLNLEDVLEVVAVKEVPGDAGPLTFVAFVRGLPEGEGVASFEVRPAGQPETVVARYPLKVDVTEAFAGRQVALQVRVPTIPVQHGGWYDVFFLWNEKPLSQNRFAIGVRG